MRDFEQIWIVIRTYVYYITRRRMVALKVVTSSRKDCETFTLYLLKPFQEIHVTDTVSVGHQINYSFIEVDTSGNPMLTQVPVTSSSWSNTPATPPVDTFTPSTNGATATLVATAPGADSVTVTALINGVSYTATDSVVISAAPQVLGGIQIVAQVQ
jgi:hypothetical protein